MMKPMHYINTRKYLEQVKTAAQKMELLKKRIEICDEADTGTGTLPKELEAAKKDFLRKRVEVMEMISRVPRVDFQWILSKRYIELLDWYEISFEGNMCKRMAISKHGFALPEMQDVLVRAGVIARDDADDIAGLLTEEETMDIGTMEDYLKYKEEKKCGEVSAS